MPRSARRVQGWLLTLPGGLLVAEVSDFYSRPAKASDVSRTRALARARRMDISYRERPARRAGLAREVNHTQCRSYTGLKLDRFL